MDNIIIEPKMLKGIVTVPPSKSVAHRAVIAAALSQGDCVINNIALSDDIRATLNGIRMLGCKYTVNQREGKARILPKKSRKALEDIEIDCGESGSTLRFLIPISLIFGKNIRFVGHGRLMERPMKPYFNMFEKKGIHYEQDGRELRLCGKLTGGRFEMPGNVSSQFITGLMFALPLLKEKSEIVMTTEVESKSYIDITLKVLKDFGIEIKNYNYMRYEIDGGQTYIPREYTIEGDYSQAAFFLAAGALGCDIWCDGLTESSTQGDSEIVDIIKRAGAKIEKDGSLIRAKQSGNMHGITVDARNIPDLVPILAALLCFCKGESRIINAGRLRMKESDRLAAIASELKHLGADITEFEDSLKIVGKQVLECKNVSAWRDHRIAMALSIAACRCEGRDMMILGAETAVKKSYPDFYKVYKSLM